MLVLVVSRVLRSVLVSSRRVFVRSTSGPHGDGAAGVGFMLTTPFSASLPQMYHGFGSDLCHKYILYLYLYLYSQIKTGGAGTANTTGLSVFKSDPHATAFRVGQDWACAIPMVDDGYLEFGNLQSTGSTGATQTPWSPFSALSATAAQSWWCPVSGNPPTADVGDADVMGQTAGGRSCFLMSCTTGFTAGHGPYEIELFSEHRAHDGRGSFGVARDEQSCCCLVCAYGCSGNLVEAGLAAYCGS